jgi:hypothetical protein
MTLDASACPGGTMIILLVSLLLAAEDEKTTLRYLKPAGEKCVLESEVTITKTKTGSHYVSRTVRGDETLTLRVERDARGQLLQADIVQQKGEVKKTAKVEPHEGKLRLTRGGVSEDLDIKDAVIFTTAPDWSDILEMGMRFDPKKEGKQEFAGLWFHPTQPPQTPKFSIVKVGSDTITLDGTQHVLLRCQVRLRGGSAYRVWVLENGRVCRIIPEAGKGHPVVLEGFEKATKELK